MGFAQMAGPIWVYKSVYAKMEVSVKNISKAAKTLPKIY